MDGDLSKVDVDLGRSSTSEGVMLSRFQADVAENLSGRGPQSWGWLGWVRGFNLSGRCSAQMLVELQSQDPSWSNTS